jgi:hypothetical protein
LNVKTIDGENKYEVKWIGYEKTTWESHSKLAQDCPLLIIDFYKNFTIKK